MLNHYKADVLARLAERPNVELTVLMGSDPQQGGYVVESDAEQRFATHRTSASYWNFGRSPRACWDLICALRKVRPDVVLVPAEKKFLPFVLFSYCLRVLLSFRLITLNHPICGKFGGKGQTWNTQITKLLYRLFDRVGFYTESARDWAVEQGIVGREKSFFANNTLDTKKIWEEFPFEIKQDLPITLLYIGRLVESKRVDKLLAIYEELCALTTDAKLKIIGAGPEEERLQASCRHLKNIEWVGQTGDQQVIGQHMRQSHVVVIPGASGLSIVHAFCFGKPYVTMDAPEIPHGPEIAYLRHDDNGLFLDGENQKIASEIQRLVQDSKRYETMCRAAFATAESVSIDRWCEGIETAIGSDQ